MAQMSRSAKRQSSDQSPQGPSRFFIVAIILGLIVFIWLFSLSINRPAQPAAPPASTSS